jgi:hypothetical protein
MFEEVDFYGRRDMKEPWVLDDRVNESSVLKNLGQRSRERRVCFRSESSLTDTPFTIGPDERPHVAGPRPGDPII